MFPAPAPAHHHCIFRCHGVPNNYPYHLTGVAVNEDGEIIVVDTANNTVQVFDEEGSFVRSLGNNAGEMYPWNSPRKVAVDMGKSSAVVIEDPPSGEIVILNTRNEVCQTALPKMTSPRAVTVDRLHRIIVVEDQPEPRVVIFNSWGIGIFNEFSASEHLQEPVGIVADQAEDKIFVCDKGACCVKVFSFNGQFLYQFAEGVPNLFGICMSPDGEVVLGDNSCDSNFIFYKQDGTITASYCYGFISDKFSDISFIRNEYVVLTTLSGSVVMQPYVYPHLMTTYSISMPIVQVRGSLREGDVNMHTPSDTPFLHGNPE